MLCVFSLKRCSLHHYFKICRRPEKQNPFRLPQWTSRMLTLVCRENNLPKQDWDLPDWGTAPWKESWGSWWTSSIWVSGVLLQHRKSAGWGAASTQPTQAKIMKSLFQFTQHLSGHAWNTVLSFSSCYTKQIQAGWRGFREEPQRWSNMETLILQEITQRRWVVMGTRYSWGDSGYTQKEKFSHENNQLL